MVEHSELLGPTECIALTVMMHLTSVDSIGPENHRNDYWLIFSNTANNRQIKSHHGSWDENERAIGEAEVERKSHT